MKEKTKSARRAKPKRTAAAARTSTARPAKRAAGKKKPQRASDPAARSFETRWKLVHVRMLNRVMGELQRENNGGSKKPPIKLRELITRKDTQLFLGSAHAHEFKLDTHEDVCRWLMSSFLKTYNFNSPTLVDAA